MAKEKRSVSAEATPQTSDPSQIRELDSPPVIDLPAEDRVVLENFVLKRQALEATQARVQAQMELIVLQEQQFHNQLASRLGMKGKYRIELEAGKAILEEPFVSSTSQGKADT